MAERIDKLLFSPDEPALAADGGVEEEDFIQEIPAGEIALPLPGEAADQRLPRLHAKARNLPAAPGVYLMKDTRGVVIYVGKSRSLRDRVASYFLASTDLGPAKQRLLDYVVDFDTLDCDSEVEALLVENRLIKDVKPRFNARLSDGKSYPFLEITTREDYPGVYVTREPQSSGSKLLGPFISASALKNAVIHLQRAFKFRTCHLEILEEDQRKRFFRPCLLYSIGQCSAPCADKISRDAYREDIDRFRRFLETSPASVLQEMTAEMDLAAAKLEFERAAALRDQIRALSSLSDRGKHGRLLQPELFFRDLQGGLRQLQDILELPEPVRSIEAIDIAHFQGEATVGSLVCFIDGRPFKDGYRRFRIKTVAGIDDYRCIAEVVSRRYRNAGQSGELYPDVILIDGGLGQLHAAQAAFATMDVKPPMVISLAKREEEIFVQARQAPLRLSRTSQALKMLQHVRDEAHRFAQNYHHVLIARRQFNQNALRVHKAARKARAARHSRTSGPMAAIPVGDHSPPPGTSGDRNSLSHAPSLNNADASHDRTASPAISSGISSAKKSKVRAVKLKRIK